MPFLQGFGVGLLLMFIVGPVFFTLLNVSLSQGLKTAAALAFGIFVSDIICVVLCTIGSAELFEQPSSRFIIGLMGGALLCTFGFRFTLHPKIKEPTEIIATKNTYYLAFAKGFAVNFLNPTVFAIWLSIIGVASGKYGYGAAYMVYMSGTLIAILLTDLLKAVFAQKLTSIIKANRLTVLFRLVGLLMFFFGIRLLVKTVMGSG